MSTAAFTWAAWDTTHAWENLVDCALSGVTYARDATDVAAKFTFGSKSSSASENARKTGTTGTGDSWASIFGIPANSTVTQIQCTAWKKKVVANTKLTSHSLTVNFVNDSGAAIIDSPLLGAVSLGTGIDGSYIAQSAGGLVNVSSGAQAASTLVRLSLEYSVVTSGSSGSASVDVRIDDFEVTITYTEGSGPPSGVFSKATRLIVGGIG